MALQVCQRKEGGGGQAPDASPCVRECAVQGIGAHLLRSRLRSPGTESAKAAVGQFHSSGIDRCDANLLVDVLTGRGASTVDALTPVQRKLRSGAPRLPPCTGQRRHHRQPSWTWSSTSTVNAAAPCSIDRRLIARVAATLAPFISKWRLNSARVSAVRAVVSAKVWPKNR